MEADQVSIIASASFWTESPWLPHGWIPLSCECTSLLLDDKSRLEMSGAPRAISLPRDSYTTVLLVPRPTSCYTFGSGPARAWALARRSVRVGAQIERDKAEVETGWLWKTVLGLDSLGLAGRHTRL
jgi:hypothetical protein